MTTHRIRRASAGTAALLALLGATLAHAAGLEWGQLSAPQQALLAGVQQQWATLPADRQERLALGAQRWLQMSPEQQLQARDRLALWQGLSPDQRAGVLAERARFRALPPDQQKALQQQHDNFSQMPADEQQRLRDEFARKSGQGSAPGSLDECLKRKSAGESLSCSKLAQPVDGNGGAVTRKKKLLPSLLKP
ncbi:MAG TPA: DUF3106 domain-containing protein [Candidatus Binatia bacterium]|nr:DUF3106 domain-containing protein [Candidatus Binatia bacterium]